LNSSKETLSLAGQVGKHIVFAHVLPRDRTSAQNVALGGGSKPQGGMTSAPVAKISTSSKETLASPAILKKNYDKCYSYSGTE
jgi:hypothetical protein